MWGSMPTQNRIELKIFILLLYNKRGLQERGFYNMKMEHPSSSSSFVFLVFILGLAAYGYVFFTSSTPLAGTPARIFAFATVVWNIGSATIVPIVGEMGSGVVRRLLH